MKPRPIAIVALGLCAALAAFGAAGVPAKKKRGFPLGPYPSLGSCQVFPKPAVGAGAPAVADESAWNQDISQAPLDANSAAYISYINGHGGNLLHPDFGSPRAYGFPYAVVAKAKKTKVRFTAYGDESTHGAYRVPLTAPVEGGKTSDGDRHVLTVDTSRCLLYELYRAFPKRKPRKHWNADAGVIWDLGSAALRTEGFTSADAAGLPIFPGLVRFEEAASGQINHAIRLTVDSTQKAWINPASHCAGDSADPAAPPMGLRMRLKAGYDVSAISGPAHAIAVAMQHYGFIVADNGSNWYFSGTSDRRWDDGNLNQLKAIPGSAFEVVQSAGAIHHC
ncbi:MAG: hypothetical protein ACXWD7_06690 [Solirubrobacterales bacterium]